MYFDYTRAVQELYKKYNLEYFSDREKIIENSKYLYENNCYIDLYGFEWVTNSTNKSMRYNRTPVRGRFSVGIYGEPIFYEYHPTRLNETRRPVDGMNRHYALTEYEAIQGYNHLIDKHLDYVQKELIDWANSYRIY